IRPPKATLIPYTTLFRSVKPTHRNRALGHVLIQSAIEIITKEFNTNTITISAQEHLCKFYETHGFVKTSDTYLEDNIPHIEMLRDRKSTRLNSSHVKISY